MGARRRPWSRTSRRRCRLASSLVEPVKPRTWSLSRDRGARTRTTVAGSSGSRSSTAPAPDPARLRRLRRRWLPEVAGPASASGSASPAAVSSSSPAPAASKTLRRRAGRRRRLPARRRLPGRGLLRPVGGRPPPEAPEACGRLSPLSPSRRLRPSGCVRVLGGPGDAGGCPSPPRLPPSPPPRRRPRPPARRRPRRRGRVRRGGAWKVTTAGAIQKPGSVSGVPTASGSSAPAYRKSAAAAAPAGRLARRGARGDG